ncbi:MAG: CoB--CoM heterodisulfide reductase iron-sulfur subunit A family protein [Candidatus Aminicenantes bacterium]|nr:CoB--CoM heterodisulfide reductase iron-sulfur subunit A family protein [Candidatus Aminicenantes bacterium]
MEEKKKKIGVYICHCGGNISDHVDVEEVRRRIEKEYGVTVAKTSMFTCSDASQNDMIKDIREQRLDGLVVASCSPKLHLTTFRNMSTRAGLNPFQYVQVNIREQCSWAHSDDHEGATCKAANLVGAGIEKTMRQEALQPIRVTSVKKVLVIGAGIAGMRAALELADLGVEVFLVEREAAVGGRVAQLGEIFPAGKHGAELIAMLLAEIKQRANITLFLNAELSEKSGHIGEFELAIRIKAPANGRPEEIVRIQVGAIVVASGFSEYEPKPGEFAYGQSGVVTLSEFERLLQDGGEKLAHEGREVKNIAFIYCVGSRQGAEVENANRYCSRFCCSTATHLAVQTKKKFPGTRSYHFYRDMRTYGKFESLYEEAGKTGSLFLRFDEKRPPRVEKAGDSWQVIVHDLLTGGEEVVVEADLVVLVTGMMARPNDGLTQVLKLPLGADRFYNEIHPKLRPVETVIDGVYITGSCQGPKNAAESVVSSLAAVSKAAALLVKGYIDLQPFVAYVKNELCVWCGKCAAACPYSAIEKTPYGDKEIARVVDVLCKGCGACLPPCPLDATQLKGYTDEQIEAMIDVLAREAAHEG